MPTPIVDLWRLIERKEAINTSGLGTALASSIPGGVNLADWTVTFEDDFDNIAATIGNNGASGVKWFAPGTEPTVGVNTGAPVSSTSPTLQASLEEHPVYTQHDSTTLAMNAWRDPGVARWGGSLNTAHFGATMDAEPTIGFAQQYGYFETRFKSPNPFPDGEGQPGSNVLHWPAFWLRSINMLGGSTGNLFTPNIEPDIVELYHWGTTEFSQDYGHHMAWHHHEPRKLVAPGYWSRDVRCGNYERMTSNATWSTDGNFRFWNDYHTYGLLMTPTEAVIFFDRKEVCRLPMLEEFQQKYYLLLSHQLQLEGSGGMTPDVVYPMLVDYVRVWQNPDWHATGGTMITRAPISAGGTANARTFTTGLAMAAYSGNNGRLFALQIPAANTGAATLSANGLSALPIRKLVNGSPVALTGGEMLTGGWHCFRLDTGTSTWVLTNPGWSMKHPVQWSPAPVVKTPRTIDVEEIEAALAEKHGVPGDLFPEGHAARSPMVPTEIVAPRMPVGATFQVVEGGGVSSPVGTVTIVNTPPQTTRYVLTGNSKFSVNPATGEISRKAGETLAVGEETMTLWAWAIPPVPTRPGSNACNVTVIVRPDTEFDPSFFEYDGSLKMWLDAQESDLLTLDADSKVEQWVDRSSAAIVATQPEAAQRPTYSATGLNSLPAVSSSGNPINMVLSDLPVSASKVTNVATRSGNTMSISLDTITRISAAFDYLAAHVGMFVWAPGSVECWVNDVNVGMAADVSLAGITTTGCFMWVMDGAGAGGSNVGRIYESSGARIFGNSTNNGSLNGALGEVAIVMGHAITADLRAKLFGYAHHRWGLTSLLSGDHPYKTVEPRMFD